MNKQLKDYLYLYYGCMVARFDQKGERFKDVKNEAWLLEAFERVQDKQGKNYYTYKPILRPLSDMTVEEANYFAWLCMDSEHHLKDRISQDEIQSQLVKYDGGLLL